MINRRQLVARCSAAGLGSTLFPGALLALASGAGQGKSSGAVSAKDAAPKLTIEMLEAAAAVVGISLSAEQRTMMLEGVQELRNGLEPIRAMHLANAVAPAMVFDPLPVGFALPVTSAAAGQAARRQQERSYDNNAVGELPEGMHLPGSDEELAFATVAQLGTLLRAGKVTSTQLTKLSISRLKKYDPQLHFVITLLEDRALAQAAEADREIAAGKYRGPLHGIPWGAKDLLAVKGAPTTWGAGGFEHQQSDEDATVVQRLDAAGAVLVAKLTLGALAQGDVWFGGRTRNPWNPKQGSSGSSAGSASAVSAGCVGFAIGSETLGSISSPATRCGVTGYRPTFGYVPRTGAMALSWSMDKLGPLTRIAEDAVLVMQVIHGPDGHDKAVRDLSFNASPTMDVTKLRIGYIESAFAVPSPRPPDASATKPEAAALPGAEALTPEKREAQRVQQQRQLERRIYDNRYDRATLDLLRGMGVQLIPVKIPDLPLQSITPVLEAEAAAAFDELTRSGRYKLLTAQSSNDWPNIFRTARMYSAVDYIQAMRARSVLIERMAELFRTVDVIVTPSGGPQLVATNLSGHPAVIVPNGLRGNDAPASQHTEDGAADNVGGPGTPVSITFLGQLYDDARLLQFAAQYQSKTDFHKQHPKLN